MRNYIILLAILVTLNVAYSQGLNGHDYKSELSDGASNDEMMMSDLERYHKIQPDSKDFDSHGGHSSGGYKKKYRCKKCKYNSYGYYYKCWNCKRQRRKHQGYKQENVDLEMVEDNEMLESHLEGIL